MKIVDEGILYLPSRGRQDLDGDGGVLPEMGRLPAVAGEEQDLARLRLLPQEVQGGGAAGVVKAGQGVVQDDGDGVPGGQDQVTHRQPHGQIQLVRRSGGEEPPQVTGELSQPPFLLNTRNRTLEKNGQRIKLTQVEYSIMRVFMENPGKALSREEILDMVWGRDYFGELKIVDVNIRRLRLKIEDNVQNPAYITTVWGYGYKWGL